MKSDPAMPLFSVGIINNEVKTPFLTSGKEGITMEGTLEKVRQEIQDIRRRVSTIQIHREFSDLLFGIEDYSHLMVLFWGHMVPEENRSITRVHPMGRKENQKVGIFATCSPVRPNPILTTVVKLVERRDNCLRVTGLDAVDQSPVLDIKPYIDDFRPPDETRIPEWMARIIESVHP